MADRLNELCNTIMNSCADKILEGFAEHFDMTKEQLIENLKKQEEYEENHCPYCGSEL